MIHVLPAIQLQLYPLGHVRCAGIDSACWSGIVQIFERDHLQLSIHARMRGSVVAAGLVPGRTQVGMVHPERGKDALPDVVIPSRGGHCGNDLAGCHVEQVVVSIVAAETGLRFHEAQLVDDVFPAVGGMWPEQEIAFAQAHATAVGQQIADGHLVRNVGIVHDESRKPLVDRIVPGELAFIYEGGECGGGEGFGVRTDPESGEFVDRSGVTQFAHAISLSHEGLAIFHNCDRHPGNVERLHRRSYI